MAGEGSDCEGREASLAPNPMADTSSRSRDLDKLLLRPGNLVGPRFEPGPEVPTPSSIPIPTLSLSLSIPFLCRSCEMTFRPSPKCWW